MKSKTQLKEKEPMLKQTTIRVPAELIRRAKIAGIEQDKSLQGVIIEALEAYLKARASR
jgi:hypothetical protein